MTASDVREAPFQWRNHAWALLLVVSVIVLFLPTLDGYFLADDFGNLHLYSRRPLSMFHRYFHSDVSEGIWGSPQDHLRPVFAIAFKSANLFFGVEPRGFHAVAIGLHLANVLLIIAIASTLLQNGNRTTAILAGTLYGITPINAETVSWISGALSEALPTCCYLTAFFLFMRFRASGNAALYPLCFVVFLLGLFAKETVLTLPLMILVYDLFFVPHRESLRREIVTRLLHAIPLLAATVGYLHIRLVAFGSLAREEVLTPRLIRTLWSNQLSNLRLAVFPTIDNVDRMLTILIAGGAVACCFWLGKRHRTSPLVPGVGVVLAWVAMTWILPTISTSCTVIAFALASDEETSASIAKVLMASIVCGGVIWGFRLANKHRNSATLMGALIGLACFEIASLPLMVILVCGVVAYALWLRKQHGHPHVLNGVCFGLVWFAITSLPLIVTYSSPRHLYLPAAGVYIAVACLLVPAPGLFREHMKAFSTAVTALVVITFALQLSREVQTWTRAGVLSREVASGVARLTPSIPSGSTIVLKEFPKAFRNAFVWQWAIPYALQPPFVGQDLYKRYTVVVPPDLLGCSFQDWWLKTTSSLSGLSSNDGESEVFILQWDSSRADVVLRRNRVAVEKVQSVLGPGADWSDLAADDPRIRNLISLLDAST